MKNSTRTLALAATLASQAFFIAAPALTSHAAGAPTAQQPLDQRVRESERKQQMIRTQTTRIGEELGAIIGEFENNGLGEGEDVKVLRAIKNVLGKLSDKEMARVIDLLGSARGGDDVSKTKAKVAEAFGGQKTIVVELRQLLLEYQRQQELYELSLRFAQLAARQNGNLKEAKRLVRLSQNKTDRFDEAQKISLSVQKDEQTAIRDEAMAVINRLGGLAKDTDSAIADRLNQSLQAAQKGKIEESLKGAVEELKAANLFRAASSEKNARDQLRELSRLVAPPKDAQEILRQAAAELERIIIDQQQTIAFTQTLRGEVVRASSEPYYDAEDKQGDVVDRTDGVQKDIEHVVPLASEQCKKAEDKMQEARSQILEKRRDDTVKSQEQAIVHLEAARKLVLEELNKQEKKDEVPVDKLALAKELKEKVSELKKEQEEIKKQTEAVKDQPKTKENKPAEKLAQISPEQTKLQAAARDLQPQAATESVPAADAIAEAAKEMGKAQQAIDKAAEKKDAKVEQATAPQQAAIDNLAKAEQLLDKQIAQLEQAKTDLDKLEQTREKIAELIKNENKIEIATAKAEAMQKPADAAKPDAAKPDAAKPDGAKPDGAKPDGPKPNGAKPDAAKPDGAKPADPKAAEQAAADAKALAGDQEKNADATAQAAAEIPAAAAEAAQPLNAAKGDMKQAAGDLQKGDAAAARPDEKQAVANLEKAKDAIDKKINDLQNQLGQPPTDAQAAANAGLAQAIAKAQGDIAQAMQQQQGGQQPAAAAAAQPAQVEKPQGKGEPAQGETPQGKGQPAQAQGDKPQGQGNTEQAKALENTAKELSDAAAEASAPAAVDAAIAQATDALAQAAGAAQAGDKPATQSNAANAQSALAQAAAALAMAQQGASSNAQANAKGQGQGEPGQGEGQEPAQGEGQGQGQGQGQKGQGKGPSQSTAEGQGQGAGERMSGHAAAADNGDRGNNRGKGQFINLPKRDRNAIMQSRKESAPSEYAPAIEQYLRNLADNEEK